MDAAIAYMKKALAKDGLENIHGEEAMIPKWVRGKESAHLVQPRPLELKMLGLGTSVATPPDGITAFAIVVTSFDDLAAKQKAGLTQGKIIVFNQYCDWVAKPTGLLPTLLQFLNLSTLRLLRRISGLSVSRGIICFSCRYYSRFFLQLRPILARWCGVSHSLHCFFLYRFSTHRYHFLFDLVRFTAELSARNANL